MWFYYDVDREGERAGEKEGDGDTQRYYLWRYWIVNWMKSCPVILTVYLNL